MGLGAHDVLGLGDAAGADPHSPTPAYSSVSGDMRVAAEVARDTGDRADYHTAGAAPAKRERRRWSQPSGGSRGSHGSGAAEGRRGAVRQRRLLSNGSKASGASGASKASKSSKASGESAASGRSSASRAGGRRSKARRRFEEEEEEAEEADEQEDEEDADEDEEEAEDVEVAVEDRDDEDDDDRGDDEEEDDDGRDDEGDDRASAPRGRRGRAGRRGLARPAGGGTPAPPVPAELLEDVVNLVSDYAAGRPSGALDPAAKLTAMSGVRHMLEYALRHREQYMRDREGFRRKAAMAIGAVPEQAAQQAWQQKLGGFARADRAHYAQKLSEEEKAAQDAARMYMEMAAGGVSTVLRMQNFIGHKYVSEEFQAVMSSPDMDRALALIGPQTTGTLFANPWTMIIALGVRAIMRADRREQEEKLKELQRRQDMLTRNAHASIEIAPPRFPAGPASAAPLARAPQPPQRTHAPANWQPPAASAGPISSLVSSLPSSAVPSSPSSGAGPQPARATPPVLGLLGKRSGSEQPAA